MRDPGEEASNVLGGAEPSKIHSTLKTAPNSTGKEGPGGDEEGEEDPSLA
jgi:hypothetical protein